MEDILQEKLEKLKLLETSTLILKNEHSTIYKEDIKENLLETRNNVRLISDGIKSLRMTLENLRKENECCKEMLSMVQTLSKKIEHMEKNIPVGIKDYLKLQEDVKPEIEANKENVANVSNVETFTPDAHSSMRDCKKSLFKELEVCPLLTPLTQEEFEKIPKYIIGRQSLEAINGLITIINQIVKAKYTLLSLEKNGARKKGVLDLYLEYKKQQTSVEEGEGKIYFFTAEDYQKHTTSKLDKIKLNMLTALRSCRKLREIRIGKLLYYMVVEN